MFQDDKSISPLILALMAALTGVFVGGSVWALAAILGWVRPWAFGVGAWAVSSALSWLMLLQRWWAILEAVLDVDLALHASRNRDGVIGYQEPPNTRIIAIDKSDPGMTQGWIIDGLPGGERRFARLSHGVLNGRPLSEREWTGSGGIYSQSEFRELRDYLIDELGWWAWANEAHHRQGIDLRVVGRSFMRQYASMYEGDPLPRLLTDGRE